MPERETSLVWRPFVARKELPLMQLQAAWKFENEDRVELFITNYFIGRFPPEYNAELIERFECECIEARKGWLKERNLEYVDSVVAMYRVNDNERHIPDVNDYVQAIVESIEEKDRQKGVRHGTASNNNS